MADDLELLQAAKAGDRAALDELLARHEQQIYRFGLRMCGNEHDARDILQETLTAAFRSLGDYRGEGALSTWLYQIARSFCIKERRRERHGETLDDRIGVADPEPAPDARAHAREIGAALAAAVSALPPDHREAVILRDVEGLSAEEAAQVTGIEVGALKSRLHRGRLELRGTLETLLGEQAGDPGSTPCAELAAELGAYAAADIDQAACARIEEHLSRCPRCAGACDALQRTVSLCQRIPGNEVPPSVRAAVRHALRGLDP